MLLSFIIKYFKYLYNYCDESMHAHSSVEYFGLYNFADTIIILVMHYFQLLVHYSMM